MVASMVHDAGIADDNAPVLPGGGRRSDMTRLDWERSRHGFSGFDRFAGCCLATCSCGWSGDLEQTEDQAIVDYGRHLRLMRSRRRSVDAAR